MRIAVLLAVFYTTTSLPTRSPDSESDDSYEDDDESWECGTDEFSKYISENQIDLDCPKIKSGSIIDFCTQVVANTVDISTPVFLWLVSIFPISDLTYSR